MRAINSNSLKSIVAVVSNAILIKASSFFISLFLSRGLSAEDFGVFAYFASMTNSLNSLGGAGVGQVVIRESAKTKL